MNETLLWAAIFGGEVTLLAIGLLVLIGGWISPGLMKGDYIVRSWPARIMGLILMLAMPFAFIVATTVDVIFLVLGQPLVPPASTWVVAGIHVGLTLTCLGVSRMIAQFYREPIHGTRGSPVLPAENQNDSQEPPLR